MGNPKQKWTAEEEEALVAGVAKHGTGKWKDIQRDPEFNRFLLSRSNIDLKDKWRNMTAATGAQGGARERSRTPKSRPNLSAPVVPSPAPALPAAPNHQEGSGFVAGDHSIAAAAAATNTTAAAAVDDEAKKGMSVVEHGKPAPKYGELIFEAIAALDDPNGVDINAIIGFIEKKEELPHNFRRPLSDKLRRLVAQEKLEKVQNRYRAKESFETKTPMPIQAARPKNTQYTDPISIGETLEEAAVTVSNRISEAENKSFVAAEAVKEAERVAKIAEDTALLLQIAEEIFQKCSRGEVVMLR